MTHRQRPGEKEEESAPAPKPTPHDDLEVYSNRLGQELTLLAASEAEAVGAGSILPGETRDAFRSHAEAFRSRLADYEQLTASPQPPWKDIAASGLELLLEEVLDLQRSVAAEADAVVTEMDGLRERAGSVPPETPEPELLAAREAWVGTTASRGPTPCRNRR